MILRAAETAEVKQAFRRAAEHNAHPVHQVNDAWRCVAHCFDRRLIREEVAAVYRIVEVLPWGVAFALCINRTVDAALRAYRVGTLYRNEREQVDVNAGLRCFNRRHQAGETAADDDYFIFSHIECSPFEVLLQFCSSRSKSPMLRRTPLL
ncbi:hypothetical protein D3C84_927650 [compost metagenome]